MAEQVTAVRSSLCVLVNSRVHNKVEGKVITILLPLVGTAFPNVADIIILPVVFTVVGLKVIDRE